jgi:hypothetical protein
MWRAGLFLLAASIIAGTGQASLEDDIREASNSIVRSLDLADVRLAQVGVRARHRNWLQADLHFDYTDHLTGQPATWILSHQYFVERDSGWRHAFSVGTEDRDWAREVGMPQELWPPEEP